MNVGAARNTEPPLARELRPRSAAEPSQRFALTPGPGSIELHRSQVPCPSRLPPRLATVARASATLGPKARPPGASRGRRAAAVASTLGAWLQVPPTAAGTRVRSEPPPAETAGRGDASFRRAGAERRPEHVATGESSPARPGASSTAPSAARPGPSRPRGRVPAHPRMPRSGPVRDPVPPDLRAL